MPHVVAIGLLASGTLVALRVMRREAGRITRRLDEIRNPTPAPQPVPLRRDPETGVYRPQMERVGSAERV